MSARVIDKSAWIHLEQGRLLSTRSCGRGAYYVPGGKPEPGESRLQTLVREIREELTVEIDPGTARLYGVFEAQAHGHPDGVLVRMACYFAEYTGQITPAAEIEEVAWLTAGDIGSVSPVDELVMRRLGKDGLLPGAP
ncbi:NUDIX hydrolase [Luteipulveratus halotolerans]|uniref:DNA mismatch repair protein MutT n=1 Tax=Luteipulveratus halotolerans TaxID=1631356 RepID=A0A0L6CGC2_9MICO|nr:NUDIX domain-containing protein [Luteipulveratus halotolerans]KNX36563.1 DNA mismatch repair protein MutT [Luteipulveratus halotolerans]